MKPILTNQELLDRYIHSCKMWLPPEKMEDIAAEIRSNLESLVEDRAAEVGRELRPDEMSAILKHHGHPRVVASRYRDQPGRGLISPELFPFYWFTLRAIFAVWVTIRLIVLVFTLQGTRPTGSVLLTLGRDVLLGAFFIPAGVTLLFAVWEYLEFKFRYSERWTPESLPPVTALIAPPKRPGPVVQVVGSVAWLVFWTLALFVPQFFWVWGGRGVFSASEKVYAMRPAMWLFAVCWIALSSLSYTRFATAEWRRFLRTAMIVVGSAAGIVLLRGGDLLVAGPKWDPTQAGPLATLNQMVAGIVVLACIFSGLVFAHELRRFLRRSGQRSTNA